MAAADEEASGPAVRFWDLRVSDGVAAKIGDLVTVYYQLALGDIGDADGPWLDDAWIRDEPMTFQLGTGEVLRGIEEALVGMRLAAERRIVIPPELAFGERGLGDRVPPGATLTVHLHLTEVQEATLDPENRRSMA